MVVYHARVRVNSVTSIHWTIHFLLLRSRNIEHVVTHGMLLILEFWLSSRLLIVLSLCLRSNSLSISCSICPNEFLHLRVISDLDSIYIEFFARARRCFHLIIWLTAAEQRVLVELIEMMVGSKRRLIRYCLLVHAI